MPRGKKTSPETVYQILTSWAVTGNYKETAERLGIAVSTVKKIVDENKNEPEFEKLCNEKKQKFSDQAGRVIDKAMRRLEREIEDESKEIPVNHLTTVIGTLYDKKALADGGATENLVVEVKLPQGAEEYAG